MTAPFTLETVSAQFEQWRLQKTCPQALIPVWCQLQIRPSPQSNV